MNVASLRQRIERALKYAPDVRAHRDDILQRLNDSLLELTLSVAWPFRVRTFGIRALGPVKVQAADYTRQDAQTFKFAVPSEWELPDRDEVGGHTLALLDATDNVLGEWVIEEATYAAGNVNVTLDPRFLDYTPTGTEIVELRFYRYRLPPDAQEILGFMARRDERGHVEMVTLAMEADLVLNQDESPGEITAALPTRRVWPTDATQATHIRKTSWSRRTRRRPWRWRQAARSRWAQRTNIGMRMCTQAWSATLVHPRRFKSQQAIKRSTCRTWTLGASQPMGAASLSFGAKARAFGIALGR